MEIRPAFFAFLIAGAFACVFGGGVAMADGNRPFPVVNSEVYEQECSSCHYLYQPGLLPWRSWKKLIKGSSDHFGENLGLDEKEAGGIGAYLRANSADNGVNEWARKISSSIGSTTPLRITETPYIQKEHRKIPPEVFKRQAIRSFSNCDACHKTAVQGDFEEDNVVVPK